MKRKGKVIMKYKCKSPYGLFMKAYKTTLIVAIIASLSFRAEAVGLNKQEKNTITTGLETIATMKDERNMAINGISPIVLYEGEMQPDLMDGVMIGYTTEHNFVDTSVTSTGIEDYKFSQKGYKIEVETSNDVNTNEIGNHLIMYRLVNENGDVVYEESTVLSIKPDLSQHISGIDNLVFEKSTANNLENNMVIDEYIKKVLINDTQVDYDNVGTYPVKFTLIGQDGEVAEVNRTVTIENKILWGIHEDYTLRGSTLQEQVWNYLIDHGLTKAQAAGVMGNISAECEWDPDAIEAGNGIGYGLIQWSFGRRDQLENFTRAMGTDRSDVKTQLTFLMMEMSANSEDRMGYCNYQFSGDYIYEFENSQNPEDTARAFCNGFERPAEFISYGSYRQTEATRFYEMFA